MINCDQAYIYIRTKITKYTKSIQAWHQINFQTYEMMACDPGNRKTQFSALYKFMKKKVWLIQVIFWLFLAKWFLER